jgi:hypothetical protein
MIAGSITDPAVSFLLITDGPVVVEYDRSKLGGRESLEEIPIQSLPAIPLTSTLQRALGNS